MPQTPAKYPYPGETANPLEVMALAEAYRSAAEALLPLGRKRHPISRAPFRLLAIHAIELYLNAFLLAAGLPHSAVRKLQHDLEARVGKAISSGLVLRKLTEKHLGSISKSREYLVSRYDPGLSALSEINRLNATLLEVAKKSSDAIRAKSTLS